MTENTAPVVQLRLATAPAPEAEPVTEPVGAPVTGAVAKPEAVTGVLPMKPTERTRLAVAHWAGIAANGAGQLWFHPGRLGHTLWTGRPGSMAEHRAYIKSREWRPAELEDHRAGSVIVCLGVAYHLMIARPLKTACLIVSAAADRPLRLTGLAVFLILFAVFVLPHIPLI